MSDAKLILLGGAVGLVAVALYRYFSRDTSIDPATGGVRLPEGAAYGPAVPDQGATPPTPVEPGYITEGLS